VRAKVGLPFDFKNLVAILVGLSVLILGSVSLITRAIHRHAWTRMAP
jgi:hypothetical protein